MRWYKRIGQVIVPDLITHTGVGVNVAVEVRVGTGVWVGTRGVNVNEGVEKVSVGRIEGVGENFMKPQAEIEIRINDTTRDLTKNFINMQSL
jgi:hypothetical protein